MDDQHTEEQPLLISRDDARQRLGLGENTFDALLNAGEIESVRIGRRRLVIATSLQAYIDRLREQ